MYCDQENSSPASILEDTEESDRGQERRCVYAVCSVTGDQAGPVWGTGEASRRRVLVMLTEECGCGAQWHEEEG